MIMQGLCSKKRNHHTDMTVFCNVKYSTCRIVKYSLISKLNSYVACKIERKAISMEREID